MILSLSSGVWAGRRIGRPSISLAPPENSQTSGRDHRANMPAEWAIDRGSRIRRCDRSVGTARGAAILPLAHENGPRRIARPERADQPGLARPEVRAGLVEGDDRTGR